MGNIECCGVRSDHRAKALLEQMPVASAANLVDDLVAFDRAYKTTNIPVLIQLLSSQSPFNAGQAMGDAFTHPWADRPKSVAALAATQLAALASSDNVEVKREIIDGGGVQELVRLLEGDSRDRREAALVALTFLSFSDGGESRTPVVLNECQAMDTLIPLIDQSIPEITIGGDSKEQEQKPQARLAAAQVCRNMFVADMSAKLTFIRKKGLSALVRLCKDLDEDFDAKLECLYMLEDLVASPSDKSLVSAVAAVPGLREILSANALVDDEEVNAAAQSLMTTLYE